MRKLLKRAMASFLVFLLSVYCVACESEVRDVNEVSEINEVSGENDYKTVYPKVCVSSMKVTLSDKDVSAYNEQLKNVKNFMKAMTKITQKSSKEHCIR